MSPSYMLRQIMDEYSELYNIQGHLTSLNPLRPQNAPDTWEQSALQAFERGAEEVLEFTLFRGAPHLRLMQPLSTSMGCLKCHGVQGYRVGDVRGGVSVSVSLLPYMIREKREMVHLVITHTLICLLGVGGIYFVYRGLKQRIMERLRAEAEREKLIGELQKALDEINTLRGTLPICSNCKNIRDDKGFWSRLETYIEEHSDASFSHGMCPSCMDQLYGKEDWYIKMKKKKTDK